LMVAKADTPSEVQAIMRNSAGSSRSLIRTFTRCNWFKGASAKRAKEEAER